jgi:transcriptional regulator PpsR
LLTTGPQRADLPKGHPEATAIDAGAATNVPLGLDIESAARLVGAAADITLVLSANGVIRSVRLGPEFARDGMDNLVGQRWEDTVTIESRPKIAMLIGDAGVASVKPKWRQVNHPSAAGADIPVLYSLIKADAAGGMIAFGRDLRATAALQQRLVDAQHSMERDYWRLRNAETRYRLLFQMSSEAVMVIDAGTQKIIEANPSVSRLLGPVSMPVVGQRFPSGFDQRTTEAIEGLLARVRSNGRAEEIGVWLTARSADGASTDAGETSEYFISTSLFRHEQNSLLLVRVSRTSADARVDSEAKSVLDAVTHSVDAFVVSTLTGTIVWANQAFADMIHAASAEKVRGEPLELWLGRTEVEYNVLMATLKQRGAVRVFAGGLRGEDGLVAEVELSAVTLPSSNPPAMAFTIRNIVGRLSHPSGMLASATGAVTTLGSTAGNGATNVSVGPTGRSVEQLTALVGRVPLKELVGETADLIEKLCIEAALGLAEDNRAAAAEMLGLSRQSLYVKMRRHAIGDLPVDEQEGASEV